jgi:tetratricopeptide (TPR) repeat protein
MCTALLDGPQLNRLASNIPRSIEAKILAEAFFRRWLMPGCNGEDKTYKGQDGLGEEVRNLVYGDQRIEFRKAFEADLLPLRETTNLSIPKDSGLREEADQEAFSILSNKIREALNCSGIIPVAWEESGNQKARPPLPILFTTEQDLSQGKSGRIVDWEGSLIEQCQNHLDRYEDFFPKGLTVRFHLLSHPELTPIPKGNSFLLPVFLSTLRFSREWEWAKSLTYLATGGLNDRRSVDEVGELSSKLQLARWLRVKHFLCPEDGILESKESSGQPCRTLRMPLSLRLRDKNEVMEYLEDKTDGDLVKKSQDPFSVARQDFHELLSKRGDGYLPPVVGSDRHEIVGEISDFLTKPSDGHLLVEAPPGYGKTFLMSHLLRIGSTVDKSFISYSFTEVGLPAEDYLIAELDRVFPSACPATELKDKLDDLEGVIDCLFLVLDDLGDQSDVKEQCKGFLRLISRFPFIHVVAFSDSGNARKLFPAESNLLRNALPPLSLKDMKSLVIKRTVLLGFETSNPYLDEFADCVSKHSEGVPLYVDILLPNEEKLKGYLDQFADSGQLEIPPDWQDVLDETINEIKVGKTSKFELLSLLTLLPCPIDFSLIQDFFVYANRTDLVEGPRVLDEVCEEITTDRKFLSKFLSILKSEAEGKRVMGFVQPQALPHIRDDLAGAFVGKWRTRILAFYRKIDLLLEEDKKALVDYLLIYARPIFSANFDLHRIGEVGPKILNLQRDLIKNGDRLNLEFTEAMIGPYVGKAIGDDLSSKDWGMLAWFLMSRAVYHERLRTAMLRESHTGSAKSAPFGFQADDAEVEIGYHDPCDQICWAIDLLWKHSRMDSDIEEMDKEIAEAVVHNWERTAIWPKPWSENRSVSRFMSERFRNLLDRKIVVAEGSMIGEADRNVVKGEFERWYAKAGVSYCEDDLVLHLSEKLEVFRVNGWLEDATDYLEVFLNRKGTDLNGNEERATLLERYLSDAYTLEGPLLLCEFLVRMGESIPSAAEGMVLTNQITREDIFERALKVWKLIREETHDLSRLSRKDKLRAVQKTFPLLARMGRVGESIKLLDRLGIGLNRRQRTWLLLNGWQYLLLNDHPMANELYQKATRLERSGDSMLALRLFDELLKYEELKKEALEVRDLVQQNHFNEGGIEREDALIAICDTHAFRGDLEEAIEFSANASEIQECDRLALLYDNWIRLYLESRPAREEKQTALEIVQKVLLKMKNLDKEKYLLRDIQCEKAEAKIEEFKEKAPLQEGALHVPSKFPIRELMAQMTELGHDVSFHMSPFDLLHVRHESYYQIHIVKSRLVHRCIELIRNGEYDSFNSISKECGEQLWGGVVTLPKNQSLE